MRLFLALIVMLGALAVADPAVAGPGHHGHVGLSIRKAAAMTAPVMTMITATTTVCCVAMR